MKKVSVSARHNTRYRRNLGFVLLALLVACTVPDNTSPPTPPNPDPPAAETSRTLTTWTIDPAFNAEALEPETRAWYRRVYLEIAAETAQTCPPPATPPDDYPLYPSSATVAACSAVKSYVGRTMSFHITSLLTLFRLTGDAKLLEEVDRLMELLRSRVRDTDGDGFRNLERLSFLGPNDFNPKEDALGHSFIPDVIYAFQKNAAASTAAHDYREHAAFWLGYLRNDFEGKWALQPSARNTEGLPQDSLFHPYMELLRYTSYMSRLVPDDPRYARLRDAMRATVFASLKRDATPSGDAFVWSHRVRPLAADPDGCLDFAMWTYPHRSMTAFMNLAFEGEAGFADLAALETMSRSLSESLLEPTNDTLLYKDIGGSRNSSGSAVPKTTVIGGECFSEAGPSGRAEGSDSNSRSVNSYRQLAWGFWATFATETSLEASEIYRTNRATYGDPAAATTELSSVHVPAAMAFARLYRAGGFSVGP